MARASHDKELNAAVNSKDWKKVATSCEDYELDAAELNSWDANTTPHYTLHLLAYLILGDTNNARFLWKRVPKKEKNTELTSVWNVGKAMYKMDLANVHKALSAVNLGDAHGKLMVTELQNSFRLRIVKLLGAGYSSISTKDASTALGFDEKATETFVAQYGWTKTGNFFTPKKPDDNKSQETDLVQLQQLTDYFCYLSAKN